MGSRTEDKVGCCSSENEQMKSSYNKVAVDSVDRESHVLVSFTIVEMEVERGAWSVGQSSMPSYCKME